MTECFAGGMVYSAVVKITGFSPSQVTTTTHAGSKKTNDSSNRWEL